MSNYSRYTAKERKAWGAKMAAARAAKKSYSGKGAYRERASYSGRGAYKKKGAKRGQSTLSAYAPYLGPALASGLGAVGSALGGPLLGAAGGIVGHLGGEAIKWFTGKGDYKVINNAFLKGDPEMIPIYNKHRGGGDVFRRCEYICDIISSSSANTFKLQSFDINPGLESSFEWLSQIACNYEEYEFEGLYYEFRSMSADALNSTNTALGQVIMAANYNAASANFTNKQSMENYEGGVSGKPSQSVRYFVECAKAQTVLSALYIRQGAVPSGQDQRMYDLGNFQIATNGMQGTSVNVGELWVCYQVVLRKPKLFAALGLYNSFASITPSTGAYTNALPLGSSGAWNYSATNTLIGVVALGTKLQWQAPTIPQAYLIYMVWTGTQVTPVVAPTFTAIATSGLTIQSTAFTPLTAVDNATVCSVFLIVTYTPPSLIVTSGVNLTGIQVGTGGTLPSAGTALTMYIAQVPNTLYGI